MSQHVRAGYRRASAPAPRQSDSLLGSRGRPLEATTRRAMEGRLGHDFSQIRVHSDGRAAVSAKSANARAYTVRNHIAFGEGQYAPRTGAGRRLIAHELVHTMQQRATPARTAAVKTTAAPANRLQRQAASTWQVGEIIMANAQAITDVKTRGALFTGADQAHVNVSTTTGRLAYDKTHTDPDDPFRYNKLKDVIDSSTPVEVKGISNSQSFQFTDALQSNALVSTTLLSWPGSPASGVTLPPLSMRATLRTKAFSTHPTKTQIYYDTSDRHALAHELFGHLWLGATGVPSEHHGLTPQQATNQPIPKEAALTAQHGITDPFGEVFVGSVDDFISRFIEAQPGTQAQAGSQTISVPGSPTEQVSPKHLKVAFEVFVNETLAVTAPAYTANMADQWKVISRSWDLMPSIGQNFVVQILLWWHGNQLNADQKEAFHKLVDHYSRSSFATQSGFSSSQLADELIRTLGVLGQNMWQQTPALPLSNP